MRILSCTIAVLSISAPLSARIEPQDGLAERLEQLVVELNAQREALHIPGMALAIVKDDQIILARGFGLADIESGTSVTPETIFAVGSSTKAFTAALIAMHVDEGTMQWDDPIEDHLPYFTMDAEPAPGTDDATLTIRDLLCHRSGFAHMNILWADATVDRETALRTAAGAKPVAPLRQAFHYNNIMFLAAGQAVATVADKDWDTLIRERIFEPLGMKNSTTIFEDVQQDVHLAKGYNWNDETGEFEHLPMRNLNTIAPAGAINSNVLDMAQWVRLQLNRGHGDGRQLISEEQIAEMWERHMTMNSEVDYGLGWFLREWKGQRVVEHGGNIDGFGAQLAFLPDSNVGFVLLTNVTATPLQHTCMPMIWEALLGSDDAPETDSTEDLNPYLGTYIANFGVLKNAQLKVLVQNGKLAVDVPGQMIYELEPPDENGKRYFTLTNQIAVSFEADDAGDVVLMKMYQAGLVSDMPRAGYEIPAEIPLDELQRYLGTYESKASGQEVSVVIQNNRLAIDVPGQMVYELHAPNDENKWIFRATPTIAVQFDDEGHDDVTLMTYFQNGAQVDTLVRKTDASEDMLTVEQVIALCRLDERAAALQALGGIEMTGEIEMVYAGVTGAISLTFDATRYRQHMSYEPFGYSTVAANGERAWTTSSHHEFQEYTGRRKQQAFLSHPAILFGDWSKAFEDISVVKQTQQDDRDVVVLRLKHADVPAINLTIDRDTGRTTKMTTMVLRSGGGSLPVVTEFDDYKTFEGIDLPFQMIVTNDAVGRIAMNFDACKHGLTLPDEAFAPPSEVTTLAK